MSPKPMMRRGNAGPKGAMPPGMGIKKGTFKRLMKYVSTWYGGRIGIVVFCIILSALASMVSTMFLQRLIDECIIPVVEDDKPFDEKAFFSILAVMATVYLIGVIASFTYTRIMAVVTQGTLKHIRDDMFDKMQTLPVRFFDTHAHGDVMSTYTNDVDAVRQLIGQSIPTLIQSILTVGTMFFMMIYYSLWMTVGVIVFLILMTAVIKKFAGASAKYMMAQQRSLASCEGYVGEMMEGQKVVKVFNHETESKERFNELNEALFTNAELANKYGNILMPILHNMGNIMYVVLAVLGGLLTALGATNVCLRGVEPITIGVIITFLGMSRHLAQTVGQSSMQVNMIAMGLAGASRCFELADEEPEKDEGYVTLVNAVRNENGELSEADHITGLWAWKHPHTADGSVTYTELKGDCVLEHVDFGYTEEKMVLHDISLYAKPGEKIAFVGATGAGKTTITNLINRFYDIPDGKIRYDGININKIKKPDLRRSLGVVLQDVNLFTGTVMDNIRYGRLDATDEECIQAAKLANADDFITRLPDGYQTELSGNGASLSQGQRQLLSIARAAVANPPIMILDEATSSIDTRTEAMVQEGMDNLMHGRTVFVIAHRLSTVRNSDAIMVLDQGRIIERGTHDELIDQKGTYYQLYTGAFELE